MTEQNVQNKNRKDESGAESRSLERRGSRSGMLDPFWSPSEFFAASPFGLMRRFAENMERAVSGEWEGFGRGAWSPAVDIAEREGKLVVHADLPGMTKDDIKVETLDNSLVISGERRQEHEEHDGRFRRSERRYGSFYRSIPLPEGSQAEQARAEFKDGVLEVSIPFTAKQKRGREVPIEAGSPTERKESGSAGAGQNRVSKAG